MPTAHMPSSPLCGTPAIEAAAITRPSYPVTIGRLSQAPVEIIDGVEYIRDVPLRPRPTPSERLSEQANRIAARSARTWSARSSTRQRTTSTAWLLERPRLQRACHGSTKFAVSWKRHGRLQEAAPEERSARRDSQRFALMRAKEIEVASAADAVITLGETMREHLIAGGVPAETITLIPNSVSETVVDTDVTPHSGRSERSLGLPEDGVWVGTAASIVGYEGLDDLVDAVILARSQGRTCGS